MGNTLGMANQDDTRPVVSALSGGRRPVLGDLAALPRTSWNREDISQTRQELQGTSPSTASHSRVASAYSPRDVTELSMHTKGTLDRELFMEGGHQSHADP